MLADRLGLVPVAVEGRATLLEQNASEVLVWLKVEPGVVAAHPQDGTPLTQPSQPAPRDAPRQGSGRAGFVTADDCAWAERSALEESRAYGHLASLVAGRSGGARSRRPRDGRRRRPCDPRDCRGSSRRSRLPRRVALATRSGRRDRRRARRRPGFRRSPPPTAGVATASILRRPGPLRCPRC